ncbi:hypothetical protein F7725_017692 [Dissostichus mawsoni]|uniref:Uncharacterized protein n=1 Tax=Dissostichus mawsoni TaxID=36200 RepID=A0A7J5XPB6_DISMA|nr:hypothetical protein F7725_017692 [Dissostichus mawsoni]
MDWWTGIQWTGRQMDWWTALHLPEEWSLVEQPPPQQLPPSELSSSLNLRLGPGVQTGLDLLQPPVRSSSRTSWSTELMSPSGAAEPGSEPETPPRCLEVTARGRGTLGVVEDPLDEDGYFVIR